MKDLIKTILQEINAHQHEEYYSSQESVNTQNLIFEKANDFGFNEWYYVHRDYLLKATPTEAYTYLLQHLIIEREMISPAYYLFGTVISNIYHTSDFSEVLKSAEAGEDMDLYSHPTGDFKASTEKLLLAFEGWGSFATITADEYQQLLKIRDNLS